MEFAKGMKLKNVKDIYGTLHKNAVILNAYKNSVPARDIETGEAFVIRNEDLGIELSKPKKGWHTESTTHFNLRKCQRTGRPSAFDHFIEIGRLYHVEQRGV